MRIDCMPVRVKFISVMEMVYNRLTEKACTPPGQRH